MTAPPDHDFWIEVQRTAYELGIAHGSSAASHANKQAERARLDGKRDEQTFWEAVAGSLLPR